MKIILIKDMENLGLSGQVLNVAPGYARNYLLPVGAALLATDSNLKMLAKKRAEYDARAKAEKDQVIDLKNKLAQVKFSFFRKAGEKGKLYGAVTAMDIAEALAAEGYDIERKRLRLSEPLKTLGEFEVPIRLHAEITAVIKVVVRPEEGGSAKEVGEDSTADDAEKLAGAVAK